MTTSNQLGAKMQQPTDEQWQFNEWVTELADPFWLKDAQKDGEFFDANGFARALLSASKPAAPLGDAQLIKQADQLAHLSGYGMEDGLGVPHSCWWMFDQTGLLEYARSLAPAAPAQSDQCRISDLIASDSYAASFQSIGQYRSELLKAIAKTMDESNHD